MLFSRHSAGENALKSKEAEELGVTIWNKLALKGLEFDFSTV